jgi:hypothetical protein
LLSCIDISRYCSNRFQSDCGRASIIDPTCSVQTRYEEIHKERPERQQRLSQGSFSRFRWWLNRIGKTSRLSMRCGRVLVVCCPVSEWRQPKTIGMSKMRTASKGRHQPSRSLSLLAGSVLRIGRRNDICRTSCYGLFLEVGWPGHPRPR